MQCILNGVTGDHAMKNVEMGLVKEPEHVKEPFMEEAQFVMELLLRKSGVAISSVQVSTLNLAHNENTGNYC